MADDSIAATDLAQVAELRRTTEAEALQSWHERQAAIPGQNLITLRAEFLRRASIIDAAYEVSVEPLRRSFLTEHPGKPLPSYLHPGFNAYNDQLHSQNKTLPSQRSPSKWAKMSYPVRMTVVAISIALVFGVVVVTSNLVSQSGGPTRAEREAADRVAVENAVESLLGPNAEQKADGFKHVGDGVLIRWATDDERRTAKKNCITGFSCFAVTAEMNADCPEGIYIELRLSDGNGTVVGLANEKTPPMYKGDRGVFAISGAVKAPKAQVVKANCY